MATKYEEARSSAEIISKRKINKLYFTGRVLAVGQDKELNNDENNPEYYSTVVPEMRLATRVILKAMLPHLRKSQRGNPAMTEATMIDGWLEANKKNFKKSNEVAIFDKNGRVK
jgi:hypothetical protein